MKDRHAWIFTLPDRPGVAEILREKHGAAWRTVVPGEQRCQTRPGVKSWIVCHVQIRWSRYETKNGDCSPGSKDKWLGSTVPERGLGSFIILSQTPKKSRREFEDGMLNWAPCASRRGNAGLKSHLSETPANQSQATKVCLRVVTVPPSPCLICFQNPIGTQSKSGGNRWENGRRSHTSLSSKITRTIPAWILPSPAGNIYDTKTPHSQGQLIAASV